ncbi:MAG: ABC transporter substrate-binding protein [Mesorhizobium sp.]|uniref:ABC transporter substrate-binding protein n=1 Tax=Mesorhizobium sp. TaxID=1871066 RepID=UPI000FE98565|nr:ABC transporter substrate-binding protein [Mesorhizobium sp.]RWI50280.1 MAG: ABC transporter substrate-binding protein [Mesorhizobium sp.]
MKTFYRCATTFAMLAALGGTSLAQTTELTVIGYGGSFHEGWVKAVIEPFEEANPDIKINVVTASTAQAASMMRAQKDNVQVDVFMMDEQGAAQTAAEGLYEPLTMEGVPNLVKLYPMFRVNGEPYARFMYTAQVLVYNTNDVTTTPTSWSELWSEAYRGRVAIADITTTPGIYLLMQLMDMAGSVEKPDVDGGFAMMERIKPNIITFWGQMAQLEQLLLQGEVSISTYPSNRAQSTVDTGAPVKWVIPQEGGYLNASTIGIAKGTTKLEAAQKYIDFVLSAEAQAANAEYSYLNPVNSEVQLAPEVAAKLPVDALDRLKTPDWTYTLSNLPAWTDRWNREITSN